MIRFKALLLACRHRRRRRKKKTAAMENKKASAFPSLLLARLHASLLALWRAQPSLDVLSARAKEKRGPRVEEKEKGAPRLCPSTAGHPMPFSLNGRCYRPTDNGATLRVRVSLEIPRSGTPSCNFLPVPRTRKPPRGSRSCTGLLARARKRRKRRGRRTGR